MIWLKIISIFILISNVSTLVPIGANLDRLRDWSRSLPWVNLVRQARIWGSPPSPWDGNATFDSITGWPNSDFGVVVSTEAADMGGTYLFYAKGNATIFATGGESLTIENQKYDASTNTLIASIVAPQNTTQIMLGFINTTGPGLQDIALLQPGYNLTLKSNITNLMLVHLSRFSMIRFKDWTNTDANSETNWNDTTPLYWPQYTPPKHNPWQTIPFIVNQLNNSVDVWISIPHNSTDDYILNVAQIMFNELNEKNTIYVEYSNEVWNWEYPQAHANLHAANDSVLNHGDPYHFNYDNCSNPEYWAWRRTAYEIKHIGDLFKTVFGEENVGSWKRIRPILAGQASFPFVAINGLDYLNAVYGLPSSFVHGIAIAPYFDLREYRTWSNLTTDRVLDGLNSSMQQFLPEQGWSQQAPVGAHGVYAAWYKLPVYAYEGGVDTASGCGNCSLDAKINATRHSRMTDICVTFLTGWYRFGFETFNWFTTGATETSRSGSWGLLEDMRQETLIDTTTMFNSTSSVAQLPRPSPKLKAIDQVRQSSIEFNFGIPIPSFNVNATNFADHPVPYPFPDLRYLMPNSTFYYPLKIVRSPIQLNLTVYVGGNAGILEGAINNEQFIQVRTPQTANITIFEPIPVMQFNINQTIVPSIVTLRLKNIQKGYSIRSFDIVS